MIDVLNWLLEHWVFSIVAWVMFCLTFVMVIAGLCDIAVAMKRK